MIAGSRLFLRWLVAASATATILLLMLGLVVYAGWVRVAPGVAPWGAPDLREEPGWFARLQLNSVSVDGKACERSLAGGGIPHTRLADRQHAPGCRYTTVVAAQPAIALRPRLVATCSLTAALVWYERAVDALAMQMLNARVVRIDHVGTYACRNVNREPGGMRSEHATANAIDITAFRLSDGRVVNIARDWRKATREAEFLRKAHKAACQLFNVVLGPDYNKAHATHFHLDLGSFRTCR